jgi:hypothetical protein
MQYGKAFTFAIKKPGKGLQNILLGVVCLFIPIVGQIVWLGYRGGVASDLDEDPDLLYHRDFDFNKFSDYLGKGVWQFLAQLLLGCLLMIPYVAMFIGMFTVGQNDPAMFAIVMLGGYGLMFVFVVLGTFFIWPLELYAALSEKVSVGRAFSFAGQFARVMWWEMLVALIVYFFLSFLTMGLGLLACCVGVYPAVAVMSLAEVHILVQLYHVYLEKGGTPIRDLDAIHDLADEE